MSELIKAIQQKELTQDTVDAQFCSDWLKDQIKALFSKLRESEAREAALKETLVLLNTHAPGCDCGFDSAHCMDGNGLIQEALSQSAGSKILERLRAADEMAETLQRILGDNYVRRGLCLRGNEALAAYRRAGDGGA